ncbi:hypothetical protein KOI35_04195 [Actinoplanes bogorensis]|uniref:Calx-beta domain-containing protein n=1 Tax=Paractinoplanes bogorensis TaxID=1610840 RepID=A0ABS5YL73_9ACTN|nr:Calx-beta domain-containing protein [Actinoplanes bogorensis]MBU2662700.1 hypothetical protein [Actinoplanes bogorensis]
MTVAAAIGFVPALMVASPASAAPGDLTIAATSAVEGGNLTFTLTRVAGGGQMTYTMSTTAGSTNPATAGTDYVSTPTPVTVNFSDSDTTKTVVVQTIDDSLYEGSTPETLNLVATPTTGSPVSAIGSITDNDTAPTYTLSASPSPVVEATGAKATITAKLDAPSGLATVVTLSSADDTAIAGSDYTAIPNGTTITIPKGDTSATADVAVTKDGIKDALDLESFTVNGTATNVSTPANRSTQVWIKDVDATPVLTLGGGGTVAEGSNLVLPLTLDHGSEKPITVRWDAVAPSTQQTGHGLATAGDDFTYPTAAQRVITIPAKSTTVNATIPITADSLNELPEDFAVSLADPTNATLGTPSKVDATITDGDSALAPTVAITPLAVTEGNSGTTSKTFTATLNRKSGRTVTVDWKTAAAGVGLTYATAVKDYIAKNGTLVFPAGTLTQTFTIDIVGDTIDEGTGETFNITLTAPTGDTSANLSSPTTAITITDDDDVPTVSFDNWSMKEGNATTAQLLPVKLSNASDRPLTFAIADAGSGTALPATSTSTAVGNNDYNLLAGNVVVQAETTTGYGVVLLNGDMINEKDETATFTATPDSAAATYLGSATAKSMTFTIENDDKAPDLEIQSVKGAEGTTVPVTGTVTGMADAAATLSISFKGQSVKGSKAADASDFTNPGVKTVTIDPGTNPGTVVAVANVALTDDTIPEPVETIVGTGTALGNFGTVTDGYIYIDASDGWKGDEPGGEEPGTKPTIKAPMKIMGPGSVEVEGMATAGQEVQLWWAPVGGGALKWAKNVTADKDGYYWFKTDITWGTRFQTMSQKVKSDEVTVWVTQDPVFVISTSTKGQLNLGVKGMPWAAGQTAAVQQWKNGGWVTMWSGKTGADGVWRASPKFASGTKVTLRAWVAGEPGKGTLPAFTDQMMATVK